MLPFASASILSVYLLWTQELSREHPQNPFRFKKHNKSAINSTENKAHLEAPYIGTEIRTLPDLPPAWPWEGWVRDYLSP